MRGADRRRNGLLNDKQRLMDCKKRTGGSVTELRGDKQLIDRRKRTGGSVT
jgi:hypothetical protein